MLAKKFALGFGIAIILPMMVHYGVSTFSPAPKWRDYYKSDHSLNQQSASPEEKAKLKQERIKQDDEWRQARYRFERNLFLVAVPVGIATIVIGSLAPIQAIGTGLMFGGIFTVIDGYCWYWGELQDWMLFLSLLVAFVVLIYIGYRKIGK